MRPSYISAGFSSCRKQHENTQVILRRDVSCILAADASQPRVLMYRSWSIRQVLWTKSARRLFQNIRGPNFAWLLGEQTRCCLERSKTSLLYAIARRTGESHDETQWTVQGRLQCKSKKTARRMTTRKHIRSS